MRVHAVEKRVTDVFVKLSAVALTPSCPRRNFTPFESCTCIPDFTEYCACFSNSRRQSDLLQINYFSATEHSIRALLLA